MAKAYTLLLVGAGLIAFGILNLIYLIYNKNTRVPQNSGLDQPHALVQLRSVNPDGENEITQEANVKNKENNRKEKAQGKSKKHKAKKNVEKVKECNATIEAKNQTQEPVSTNTNPAIETQTSVETNQTTTTTEASMDAPPTIETQIPPTNITLTPGPGEPSESTMEKSVRQAIQEINKQNEIEAKTDGITQPLENPPSVSEKSSNETISPTSVSPSDAPTTTPSSPTVEEPSNETMSSTSVSPSDAPTPIPSSPTVEEPSNETMSSTSVSPSDAPTPIPSSPTVEESSANATESTPVKEENKHKKETKTKKKIHKKEKKKTKAPKADIALLQKEIVNSNAQMDDDGYETEILDSDESTENDEYEPEILDTSQNNDSVNQTPATATMIPKKTNFLLEKPLEEVSAAQIPTMDQGKIISEVNKGNMIVIVLLLSSLVLISLALIIAEVYCNYKKRKNSQEWAFDYILLDDPQEGEENSIKSRSIRDI